MPSELSGFIANKTAISSIELPRLDLSSVAVLVAGFVVVLAQLASSQSPVQNNNDSHTTCNIKYTMLQTFTAVDSKAGLLDVLHTLPFQKHSLHSR